MSAIVFTSAGGRKYHFDSNCKAFESAQMLSDLDCGCDTYCTHRLPRMHGMVRMSSTKAALDGNLPCLTCVPPHLRELPDTETFGHMPITWGSRVICARCQNAQPLTADDIDGAPDDGPLPDRAVEWPCTSAIVLGLAPRPTN